MAAIPRIHERNTRFASRERVSPPFSVSLSWPFVDVSRGCIDRSALEIGESVATPSSPDVAVGRSFKAYVYIYTRVRVYSNRLPLIVQTSA